MKRVSRLRLILIAAAVALLGYLFLSPVRPVTIPQTGPRPAAEVTPVVYLPIIANGTAGPSIGGCPVFPSDNVWNTRIDHLPADANSGQIINSAGLGAARAAHADFGSGVWPPGSTSPIGIPYLIVPEGQAKVQIIYTAYGSESDPGPFPVPGSAPVEGDPDSDGDRHVLVVESGACRLYELYRAFPNANGSWNADSGAMYDLLANGPLRPAGWTSADAAGLPILPGLVRYDEVVAGEIRHALRFTGYTYGPYRWPARHRADGTGSCTYCPKMGQRFRLKASFDISGAPARVQVMLTAMKRYGLIMADNGSPWYLSGAPDPRWDNDELHWLDANLHGSDFEAVDTSSLMIDTDSGQARQP